MKTDRFKSGLNLTSRKELFSKRKTSKPYSEDLHQRIEKKAYELYEQRGGNHGSDWNDWFEAEKIVTSQLNV